MIIRRSEFKKSKGKRFDYHKKRLENPFFRKQKKRKLIKLKKFSWSWRGKLVIISTGVVIIGFLWFFLYSSFFLIEHIEISGLTNLASKDIKNIVWQQSNTNRVLILPQKNIISFSKSEFSKNLNSQYGFEKLSINKDLPNTLKIDIQEKPYAFIWHEDDTYYYADSDGYTIKEINPLEIEQKNYPLVDNQNLNKIISGKIEIKTEEIEYILNLFKALNEIPEINIEKFIIDKEVNTIKLVIVAGPIIYFNTQTDYQPQVDKLVIIKNELLKDDFIKKEYIDIRYGDKIYYR